MSDGVRSLSDARAKRTRALGKGPMPERFTLDEIERLLRLAAADGYTYQHVKYATRTVRYWAESNGRTRADWPMVIVNAMRMGWGLRGYGRWRRDLPERDTRLTPEARERILQGLARRRGEDA